MTDRRARVLDEVSKAKSGCVAAVAAFAVLSSCSGRGDRAGGKGDSSGGIGPGGGSSEDVHAAQSGGDGKPVYVGQHGGAAVWLCVERESGATSNTDATIGFEEKVRLGVVVRAADSWYTDLASAVIDGRHVGKARPLASLPGLVRVEWRIVESTESSWRNTDRNKGWWADIRYQEIERPAGGAAVVEVDVRPARLRGVEWKGRSVGTSRFKASVELESFVLATPGAESGGKGGVLDGVRRVSRLGGSGNTIVDNALALANLPYIWGSAPVGGADSWQTHQAEIFVGADCADLVVAAWRMSGKAKIQYASVVQLLERLESREARITGKKDGTYLGEAGTPIRVGKGGVEPGAMLAWRFGKNLRKSHSAILVEDSSPGGEPNGVLDETDLVLHTLWEPPVLEPISGVLVFDPVSVVNAPEDG